MTQSSDPAAETVAGRYHRELESARQRQHPKGIATYGEELQINNGRYAYHDFMEEHHDEGMYATQQQMEREGLEAQVARLEASNRELRAALQGLVDATPMEGLGPEFDAAQALLAEGIK